MSAGRGKILGQVEVARDAGLVHGDEREAAGRERREQAVARLEKMTAALRLLI